MAGPALSERGVQSDSKQTEEVHSIGYWVLKKALERGASIEIPSLNLRVTHHGTEPIDSTKSMGEQPLDEPPS